MRNGPYELVKAPPEYPGKKYRGKYVYEHQLVWWQTTGQVVPEGFVVHHKDENKRHNEFSNFELKEAGAHVAEHCAVDCLKPVCGWCKEEFELKPSKVRDRLKQSLSGELFCCKSHQVQYQQKFQMK